MPFLVRSMLAGLFGLPETRVRVIVPDVGGGFGLKVHLYVEEAILPLLSRLAGAPVKWVEDRYEHLAASGHSKEVVCSLELAVGRRRPLSRSPRALRRRRRRLPGAPVVEPDRSALRGLDAAGHLRRSTPSRYEVDAPRHEQVPVHGVPRRRLDVGPYGARGADRRRRARARRRPGRASAPELRPGRSALRVRDRVPLRRRQLRSLDPPGSRARRLRGAPGAATRACARRAATSASASARSSSREAGQPRSPPTRGFPDSAYLDAVCLTVEPDGSVTVATGLQSNGQGHETTLAQLAADGLGVRLEDVRVVQGDTARGAYSTGSWGSRTAVVGGGAVLRATDEVREKAPADRGARDGGDVEAISRCSTDVVSVKGSPDRSLTVAEVAGAGLRRACAREASNRRSTSTRSYDPPATYSNACIACVVEVDPETGVVDGRAASSPSRTAARS